MAGIDWNRMEWAGIGLYQPFPANSRLFLSIPAYSSLFEPIPVHSSISVVPVYFNLSQLIPAFSSLFHPIPPYISYSSLYPNLQSPIPNIQFEMPNCAFYPQLDILSVSSLFVKNTSTLITLIVSSN